MSRTIRRKGIESKLNNNNDQQNIAGVYTECDFVEGYSWFLVYREPTPDERFKQWKRLHQDGSYRYTSTVPNWGRRLEQKRHRSQVKQQIHRYLYGKAEDVLFKQATKAQKQWW